MALDNINLLISSALSPNSDKILLYRSGGLEASTTLLSLTNSALNLSGVYLDPVNQRMGIGTNSPLATAHIKGIGTTSSTTSLLVQNSAGTTAFNIKDNGVTNATYIEGGMCWFNNINSNGIVKFGSSLSVGFNTDPIAQLQIKGSGSTSATTSLLVQNSNALTNLQVTDDGQVSVINEGKFSVVRYGNTLLSTGQATSSLSTYNSSLTVTNTYIGFNTLGNYGWAFLQDLFQGYHPMIIQDATYKARETSAVVELNSKTRGFLKPKMTTAQKNAIVTPTAGLEVYDTDLNRPCFFNGTSWITL